MANIFINGISSKTGGGKSILNNYLKILKDSTSGEDTFFVLTPDRDEYLKYSNESIKIIEVSSSYKKGVLFPWVYKVVLPRLIKKLKIDVIFNLADIPIASSVSQVFLFDWPYAVYPTSTVWKMMDTKSYLIRKVKLYFFKKNLKYVSVMIAQTNTMRKRLMRLYNLNNIEIVPNAVSLENLDGGKENNFQLPKGIKLLYLSYYYPHKNFEIFIPLAEEIKRRNLEYKIIITIEGDQHKKVDTFLNEIEKKGLEKIIINIGAVQMKHVPSLYKQCDGLLMPTLLESFSGTYVEAMHHRLPILTSNIDFASGVCYDSAAYFDPFKPIQILSSIESVFSNEQLRKIMTDKGAKLLNEMPDWNTAFDMYGKIIKKTLAS